MHDRIFQIDHYVFVAAAWLEWVSTQHDSTVHLASIFNAAIIRPHRFLPFFVRNAPELKNWYLGWFVKAQTRYTEILSKNCLHAGAATTSSSFDSSTHRSLRFSIAFFLRKAIWKSNRDKQLIFGMISTGSDLIYLGNTRHHLIIVSSCHDIIIWFVNVSSLQVLACLFSSKSDLDK